MASFFAECCRSRCLAIGGCAVEESCVADVAKECAAREAMARGLEGVARQAVVGMRVVFTPMCQWIFGARLVSRH